MPVCSGNDTVYPTLNITFGLDLSSAYSYIFDADVQTMKCEDNTEGCIMDQNVASCFVLNESTSCSRGWVDGLLFNHSYEYSPRGIDHSVDGSSKPRTDLHPSQIPFLNPKDLKNSTTNLLGLSPASEFNTFVKSVYTIKYSELSFTIDEYFQLNIQPNLILYNKIFEQTVGSTWRLTDMAVYYNRSGSLYVPLERGTNSICITFIGIEMVYIRDRNIFFKELMNNLCGNDICEYTEENINNLAPITIRYVDPSNNRMVYALNLKSSKYTKKMTINGKKYIDLKVGDISIMRDLNQCDSNHNVALGITYFKYFRFEFVFGKKENYIRFHEKNNGLTVTDKFYLLNFGGTLLLIFMLAVSIRVAYKYI